MDRSFVFAILIVASAVASSAASASTTDHDEMSLNLTQQSQGSGTTTLASAGTIGHDAIANKANCNKLMEKALRTGRHYWWARYRKCLQRSRKQ